MIKNNSNQLVTRSVLKSELKGFKIEFKEELKEEFATKDDLKNELKKELKKYATKDDLHDMSDTILNRFDEVAREIKDDTNTKYDKVIKILDDLVVDNTVGTEHTRELRVDVNNHEKRLKILEAKN